MPAYPALMIFDQLTAMSLAFELKYLQQHPVHRCRRLVSGHRKGVRK